MRKAGDCGSKCSVAAQCLVLARQTVDLVQDLYSLRHTVTPQLQKLPMKSRLDRQQLREQAESSFPLEGGALIDNAVFPDLPKIRREGEEMEIESPVWCSVLYYDEAGELRAGPPTPLRCPGFAWPRAVPARPPARSPVLFSGPPAAGLLRCGRLWR